MIEALQSPLDLPVTANIHAEDGGVQHIPVGINGNNGVSLNRDIIGIERINEPERNAPSKKRASLTLCQHSVFVLASRIYEDSLEFSKDLIIPETPLGGGQH
jgi:hypothetical protein